MVDPISVAGLAIAVLDQLVKLGERSAELISDCYAFGEVWYSLLWALPQG